MINIYTDGSSRGNPGPGGYGIVMLYKDKRKELSQGYRLTTNNRMELTAVIKALEAIKNNKIEITIYSDSKYVVESIEKGWIWNWEKKNFKKKLNSDLWKIFIPLYKLTPIKSIIKPKTSIIIADSNEIINKPVKPVAGKTDIIINHNV